MSPKLTEEKGVLVHEPDISVASVSVKERNEEVISKSREHHNNWRISKLV